MNIEKFAKALRDIQKEYGVLSFDTVLIGSEDLGEKVLGIPYIQCYTVCGFKLAKTGLSYKASQMFEDLMDGDYEY